MHSRQQPGLSSLLIFLSGFAQGSFAEEDVLEEVIVTGTYIQGSPIDAPSPVDVTDRAELEARGMPNVLDMVQAMGPVTGVDGRSNQFNSQATEGTATINLRGLGPERTLVLLNGQRLASTAENYVNINAVPVLALQRVELLKDGASAVYGSDAIAGVANFITRSDFRGIEVSAALRDMDGADDPNWEAGAIAGLGTNRFDLVASFGYEFRSQVPNREKDWVLQPPEVNPAGGFAFYGNPGTYIPFSPTPQLTPDPDCETVGGLRSVFPNVSVPLCWFRYTDFMNLQEKEHHYQFFLESTLNATDQFTLHGELLYAKDDVPSWKTSPSYPNNSNVGLDRVVVPGMPHFDDFIARNPELAGIMSGGALVLGRIRGVSGPAETGTRESDTYRLSLGAEWAAGDRLLLKADYVYTRNERETETYDTRIDNLAWAYRGLGGPDCDVSAGVPGSGNLGAGNCYYYNPFTSGFPVSMAAGFEGVVSPGSDDATLRNPDTVYGWLTDPAGETFKTEMHVVDLVASVDTGLPLPGGPLAYAAGLQYRSDSYSRKPNALTDNTVTPCAFGLAGMDDTFTIPPVFLPGGSVIPPYAYTCNGAGPFHFTAAAAPFEDDQDVVAVFGEVALPLLQNLDLQLALRYEDYGAEHGDTLDPKIAARWDITSSLALRASFSTAFRAPPVSRLGGLDTRYTFVSAPVNGFRPTDITGNSSLEPETADTYNLGVIWQPGGNFYVSVDYWRFKFSQPIVQENASDVLNAASDPSSPGYEQAIQKLSFTETGLIDRISLTYDNGPDTDTDGIDYRMSWDTATDHGQFTFGARGTYINSFKVSAWLWAEAFEGDGYLNTTRSARPLPKWKNNVYLNWSLNRHNVRLDLWHTDGYKDERGAPLDKPVDEHLTLDLHYGLTFNQGRTRLYLSVYNLFDEDPPLAGLDLNYDPYTHDPFGRVVKMGVQHRFEVGAFR